jgi:hypothetical protein
MAEVGDFHPDEEYGDLSKSTSDDDDDNDDTDNEDVDNMDIVPLAVKLEDFGPEGYNEEVATAHALVLSKAEEDVHWRWERGMDEVLRLSALVVEH